MHYKDMTFCTFYEDCRDKNECHRPLTPLVKLNAKKWWGPKGEAIIAQFAEKPHCHHL